MVQKIKGKLVVGSLQAAQGGVQELKSNEFRVAAVAGNALIRLVAGTAASKTIYFANDDASGDQIALNVDNDGVLAIASKVPPAGSWMYVAKIGGGRFVEAGDADVTLAVSVNPATSSIDGTLVRYDEPIAANRTVTLTTANARTGMKWKVIRTAAATGAFDVEVGTVKVLAAGEWAEVTFNGTAWVLTGFGSL